MLADTARFTRHAPGDRWFVDETYVKVSGVRRYVYRAIDQYGQAIDVLPSGYVSPQRSPNSPRRSNDPRGWPGRTRLPIEQRNSAAGRIRQFRAGSDGTYGAPRITADLRSAGMPVNHKRVARVMRHFGVRACDCAGECRPPKDPAASRAPDLIVRDFSAPAVNQRYVGEITYPSVGERGFLHLATAIDLPSRRQAGRAIADHMRTDLVIDALTAAQRTHGSLDGASYGHQDNPRATRLARSSS